MAFGLYSEKLKNEFINESIFTINAEYFIANRSIKNEHKYLVIPLEIEPCHITHSEDFKKRKKNLYNNFFCFSKKSYQNLKIHGRYEDQFYQSIEVTFSRCINNSKCASEEEINSILEEMWIETFIFDENLDAKNFKIPISIKKKYFGYLFGIKDRMNINLQFSKNIITSDKGYIFEDFVNHEYLHLNKFDVNTNAIVNEKFAKFFIECSDKYTIIQRSYLKVPSVLAEIGGIISIIELFYKKIISNFIELIFFKEIVNSNYFYEKKKNKKNKKNKKTTITIKSKKNKELEEGKINEINTESLPCSLFGGLYLEKHIKKLKIKYFELLNLIYCKKKVKTKKKIILERVIEEITQFFNIEYLSTKFKEIDLLKCILFDENQQELFNSIPKFLYQENQKSKIMETSKEKPIDSIRKKINKNDIDKRLIEHYYFITNIED